MSNNQGSYAARFQLETALFKEHCKANLCQIKIIGRDLHQQVRIEFPTTNGTTSAIYTVSTVHNGEPGLVFLGEKIQDEINNCQEHSNTRTCRGEVKAQVPIEA